jgi:glycosyltransferase involved in cell wall biosynthesis
MSPHSTDQPIALLLVPRTVERFILYDQGQDLLRAPGVVAVEAPRVPYGVLGRLPDSVGAAMAAVQARRLRVPGEPAVTMVFHPFQYPLARALLERWPACRLWYGLFDRTPAAPDAGPRTRRRLEELHARCSERAELVFAVSSTLVELERDAGREAVLMPSAADSFPAPDPAATTVAVCFGTNGRRTDWSLLRAVGERMRDDLALLFVGALNEEEVRDDPDFRAVRDFPHFVWLGPRSNDEAARLVMCSDVGVLPFREDPFNDAGLPNRILKAARVGVPTITPDFSGLDVWERAIVRASGAEAWVEALRAARGARGRPDADLREWALGQTGERQNAPLWRRLAELGVAVPAGAGMDAGPPQDRRPEVAGRAADLDAGGGGQPATR